MGNSFSKILVPPVKTLIGKALLPFKRAGLSMLVAFLNCERVMAPVRRDIRKAVRESVGGLNVAVTPMSVGFFVKSVWPLFERLLPPSSRRKPIQVVPEMEAIEFLRLAIFNIVYHRGLFPATQFYDEAVPFLGGCSKRLVPVNPESERLINWIEKGVYDALQKKYLKRLLFYVCEPVHGKILEEYTFSFTYVTVIGHEVSIYIHTKNGALDFTSALSRSCSGEMVRTLIRVIRALGRIPAECTLLMKLQYFTDITPKTYEPPLFRRCSEEETTIWNGTPCKYFLGNVKCRMSTMVVKVKSSLDNNNEIEDEDRENCSNSEDGALCFQLSLTRNDERPGWSSSTRTSLRDRPESMVQEPILYREVAA